jgi:hypothetical protein
LKSFFTFLCPNEFNSLFPKGGDWETNLGESFYESPIVSYQALKGYDIRYILWGRPIYDGFNFFKVNFHYFLGNKMA